MTCTRKKLVFMTWSFFQTINKIAVFSWLLQKCSAEFLWVVISLSLHHPCWPGACIVVLCMPDMGILRGICFLWFCWARMDILGASVLLPPTLHFLIDRKKALCFMLVFHLDLKYQHVILSYRQMSFLHS